MLKKIEPLLDDDGFPMARIAELKGELHVSFPVGYRSYMNAQKIHAWLTAALGIGWQPIETAPKDGSLVDLWCLPRNGTNPGRMADCLWDRGSWRMLCFMSDGSPGAPIDMEVTHWMPLAAAPASPEP